MVVVIARLVTVAAKRLDLGRGITEDKDILLTHVLQHFNVGTVQRANGQRAVEGELHIAGPGELRSLPAKSAQKGPRPE
jgi:hypothetical protein